MEMVRTHVYGNFLLKVIVIYSQLVARTAIQPPVPLLGALLYPAVLITDSWPPPDRHVMDFG